MIIYNNGPPVRRYKKSSFGLNMLGFRKQLSGEQSPNLPHLFDHGFRGFPDFDGGDRADDLGLTKIRAVP